MKREKERNEEGQGRGRKKVRRRETGGRRWKLGGGRCEEYYGRWEEEWGVKGMLEERYEYCMYVILISHSYTQTKREN